MKSHPLPRDRVDLPRHAYSDSSTSTRASGTLNSVRCTSPCSPAYRVAISPTTAALGHCVSRNVLHSTHPAFPHHSAPPQCVVPAPCPSSSRLCSSLGAPTRHPSDRSDLRSSYQPLILPSKLLSRIILVRSPRPPSRPHAPPPPLSLLPLESSCPIHLSSRFTTSGRGKASSFQIYIIPLLHHSLDAIALYHDYQL